ncbi:MAG TPA: hypothetical protein VM783_17840 [Candidatus Acidoferrum sp.]|nr:hypothetical protein [Candidatus Acidoferrum sp.]
MVQRTYQPPEFRVQDTRRVTQSGVAQADTRVAPDVNVGDDSWRDRFIEGLGNTSAGLLNKMADVQFSNLYLEGQAKVGVIQSEEEIQGNPLTRDWEVAGFRDTMGKLALADSEAQFAVDLKQLRQQSPEELEAYLAQRRTQMMPGLAGMSRDARAAVAGQLLLQDRAAIKQYTSEHSKFIIEQKSQAVHTLNNTSMRNLGSKQVQFRAGDLPKADFDAALQNTAGMLVGSIWMDKSLPRDVQQQLTFETLQNALTNGSTELYDYVASNDIPDVNGKSSSLVARLTGDQQQRLGNAYLSASQRTSDARNLGNLADLANVESQIDSGAFSGTYEMLDQKLSAMVLSNAITGEKRASVLNHYTDKQYKNETNSQLASMFIRGDVNGILNSGKTTEDGAKAMDAMLAKNNVTPEQRLQTYLQAGKNGMQSAFSKAGEILGVTLRQVRDPNSTMLPQHRQMFETINAAVRDAEAKGQTDVRQQLLSGLPEGDRMFTQRVFSLVDGNASYEEAIRRATDLGDKEAALTPAVRAANAQQTSSKVSKQIMELSPRGVMSSMWTWGKSLFSKEAAADLQLRGWSSIGDRDGWTSDSPTVQFYNQRIREELASEASNILNTNPSASPEEVILLAKTNVAGRTIQSKYGPIAMPRGVSLEQVFGLGPGNTAAIGPAIDAMLKETKSDASFQVAFVNGKMFAQEFDSKGARVGTGKYIEPYEVRAKVQTMAEENQGTANERFGLGREVSSNGVSFRYNGTNTAGVPAGWMFNLRSNLVDHEGIKDTPYRDLSGALDKSGNPIMTVGVGVSSHNPNYPQVQPDGKVSSVDIMQSFTKASNDAAKAGYDVAKRIGMDNQSAFALLSEVAYQSGTGFASQAGKTGDRYRAFLDTLRSKNVEQSKEAFKQTAAWYYSADPKDRSKITPRQQSYLRLIEKSLK